MRYGVNNRYLFVYPVISALILILAFPPLEQGYLAWVGAVPFLYFCFTASRKQAWAGGLIFGAIFQTHINSYLAPLLLDYLSTFLALLALVLLIVVLSLFYGIFAYLACRLVHSFPASLNLLTVPSLWVVMEYLRSFGIFGYTAGFIGYSQWEYPFILNTVSVYGYWGIAFLMIMMQAALAMKWARLVDKKTLFAAGIAWLALTLTGLFLPSLFKETAREETFRIALVQPNNPQQELLDRAFSRTILERYMKLSKEAIESNRDLDLVVWPETAISINIGRGNPLIPEVIEIVGESNTPLLYGAAYIEEGSRYNSIVMLDPEKEKPEMYFKQRLVPFVEYFPYHRLLNRLVDLDMALGRYTPGEEINLLTFNDITIGGVICFESYFGDYTRKLAYREAEHLFVLTNDGWFDSTMGLEQHARVAAIRAAEMGIGVTQVANTGITISFDHRGEKVFKAPKNERGFYVLETNFPSRPTVYRYAGEYFLYITALSSIILTLLKRYTRVFR